MSSSDPDYHETGFTEANPLWRIPTLLSMTSTGIVVILCITSKYYKNALGFMVFWVNLTDFMFSLAKSSVLVYDPASDVHCRLLEFVANFGLRSSIIWGAAFGHSLLAFTRSRDEKVFIGMRSLYLVFAVIVPLGIASASAGVGFAVYSPNEGTCVHRIPIDGPDYQYIFISCVPIFSAIAMNLYYYFRTIWEIKSLLKETPSKEYLTLLWYPAIVVICWAPILIVTLVIAGTNAQNTQILEKIVMSLSELHGFLDAIVYGRSKNVFQEFLRCFCCCCPYYRNENKAERVFGSSGGESNETDHRSRINTVMTELTSL